MTVEIGTAPVSTPDHSERRKGKPQAAAAKLLAIVLALRNLRPKHPT